MKRFKAELTKHRKREKSASKCARDGKRVRWTNRERERERERQNMKERQERRKDKKSEKCKSEIEKS